jgi:hypothetical protein
VPIAGALANAVGLQPGTTAEELPMTEFPDNVDELNFAIGFDMLATALDGVLAAEDYREDRERYTAEHGEADPSSFPKWSEVSEPGTEEYGPYTRPWLGEDDPPQPL